MKKHLNKIFTIIISICLIAFIPNKASSQDLSSPHLFLVTQQNTIINYEKSQPSSIDNPVVDPNFNTMRAEDTNSSTATYIVIALLVVATIIPLVTRWYFSK